MLPQWHIKDPSHSAKSAGGRLHLNTNTPLTHRSQSGLCRCPGRVWEFIRKRAHTQLVTKTRSQSSQLAEPLWADPGRKSGISLRELISTKKKKKRRRGINCRTFSQNPRTREKSHHHRYHHHHHSKTKTQISELVTGSCQLQ